MAEKQDGTSTVRRLAGTLTAVAAIGSALGWLLATVFEYLQWATAARWTLHLTVALVGLMFLAALAAYVWREEDSPESESDAD